MTSAGERTGARTLLTVGDEAVTASEFHRRVVAAAADLIARGLRPGDRVVVLLERSVDEAVALLAVTAAGGVAVPVNGKLRDDQIRHVLTDAEPFGVVTSALRLVALRDRGATLQGQRLFRVGDGELPDLPVSPESLATGPPDAFAAPEPAPLPAIAAEMPAVLLYTSGSTGLARGVVQTHGNLVRGAVIVADYLRLASEDHLLALLPLSFDYGLNQLLSALLVGCRITTADHLGGGELAELLARVRPTGLAGVPSLWHEVASALESGVLTAAHGASLRYVTNSGGALRRCDSAVLRARWPHVEVFAMYGLTEAFRSAFLPPAEFDRHPESFGRAIDGVELLLVDPRTGELIEGPGTGELVHAGALVAAGYWRQAAATAARFRPDPRGRPGSVVFTGDLVRRDEAGLHWFVGRLDRMLKVHGHRVSPDEIQSALAGTPGVGATFAFGVPGSAAGDRIVLAVTGDRGDAELAPRLLRRARARLPSYMLPARIVVLDELPHNQNGKVDETALRAKIDACIGDS